MGQDLPLKACFTRLPGFEARYAEAAELRSLYASDPEVQHVVDVAKGFVDKRRQDGIHAAAVVITKEPVLEYVPVQRKSSPNASAEDAPIVTQYEATAIEKLGLLKMDFLGLRNLAIIERTLEHIRRRHGVEVDIDHVALDDPKVFEMLRLGNSIGIFQLEGDKMRQLMRRLAPTSFDDIAALNALYRPGPLSEGVHNDYADRKNLRQAVTYDHPDFEEVLGETYGLMIYQEDIMRVATKVAGFSMTEADDLRKACSKKIREMIQAQREKFVAGAERQGYGRALGETLFNKIEPFADYAFNRSHAYGYAFLGYQNAWLKANYPVEYMAALLTSFREDKDKSALYLNEARQMGITVAVPDVNESFSDYAPSARADATILFGMAAVRNVGESLVERIVDERDARGPFTSVYDFVRRVDPIVLNRRSMESLIKAGAFDSLGVARLALLLKFEEIVRPHAQPAQGPVPGHLDALRRDGRRVGARRLGGDRGAPGRRGVRPGGQARVRARDAGHLHLGPPPLQGRVGAARAHRRDDRRGDGARRGARGLGPRGHPGRHPHRGAGAHHQGGPGLRARRARGPRRFHRDHLLGAQRSRQCSGFLAKDNVVLVKGRLDHRDEEIRFSAAGRVAAARRGRRSRSCA